MTGRIGSTDVRPPVVQPTPRPEATAPRAEALRPPPDGFDAAAPAPVRLDAGLPQMASGAPVLSALGVQAQQRATPAAEVNELRRQADDFRATPDERLAATRQLGDLAASGNADAVRALSGLRTEEAGRQLLRAPPAALSADDYVRIADAAGRDPAVQAQLRARVQAGDERAIEGLSTAIRRANPHRAAFADMLAVAPQGALTPRAYEALGAEAGAGGRAALERLRTDAAAGSAGAVQGLQHMALMGISSSHRDQALDALATAAQTNPGAMEALRRMHGEGRTRRAVDQVDVYFNATARLTDPARVAAEVQHLGQRGQLAAFIRHTEPAAQLAADPLRSELVRAAAGDDGVRRALAEGLERADRAEHAVLRQFADSDIRAAGAQVMQEIGRRAETDPDLRRLNELLAVAHRSASDPAFARRVDQDALRRQLQEVMDKPSVQAQLRDIRAQSDLFGVGDRLAARIESPAYQARLQLLPPAEREATLSRDLAQLGRVDPGRAQGIAARMTAEQIAADPMAALANLPDEQRRAAVERLAPELGVDPSRLGQVLQSMVDAQRAGRPVPAVETLLAGFPDAARARMATWAGAGAHAANGLAAAVSVLGLVDAARSGDALAALSSGANMTASLSTIFSNSAGFLGSAAKWGGVVGNAASAVVSGYDAYREAVRGDYVGAAGAGLTAVGSAVVAGSVFGGPSAPAWAVAGVALMATGSVVNWFSEDDVQTFARTNGLLRQ